MAKEESQAAKEALSAAVAEKAMAAGSGHMRTGRLWQEALLRRQAEEQMVHGRRLRQEAHAAASGKLGEKGEALKEELQSLKTLMASVINAQEGMHRRWRELRVQWVRLMIWILIEGYLYALVAGHTPRHIHNQSIHESLARRSRSLSSRLPLGH